MSSFPCLVRTVSGAGEVRYSLGNRLVDRWLSGVRGGPGAAEHAAAVAFDLKAFFAVVAKDPAEVTAADVFLPGQSVLGVPQDRHGSERAVGGARPVAGLLFPPSPPHSSARD